MKRVETPVLVRFARHVEFSDSGCWLWTGAKDRDGYGRFVVDGRTRITHRAAYALFVGEVPAGLHLDHLCSTPSCVNPDHLEPVTARENNSRSFARGNRGLRSHCKRGHLLADSYIYVTRDGLTIRHCRACRVQRTREQTERRRLARRAAA